MTKIRIDELREIIRQVLEEDMAGYKMPASASALLSTGQVQRPSPPPLPPGAQKPASAALPQKGALHKFRADVNMTVDAAGRVKAAVESANTKEALRWLDKVIAFATSAKGTLGVK